MSILSSMLSGGAAKAEVVRLVMGVGVLGVTVTGMTTVATGAFFTDQQPGGSYSFTSGTVRLGVDPTEAALALPAMAPGDSSTGSIRVSNEGTLQERYSATVTTTLSALSSHLRLDIKSGVPTCTPAGFAAAGAATIYSGPLVGSTSTKVLSNRVLDAKQAETLCAQVTFVPGADNNADNALQGKTMTATVVFNSEQTANNPAS